MAQPLPYERDYDFQNFQSGHPSTPLPGDKVNAELDQVAATLDEVLARIALLQDDDTALKRGSVGRDQLAANVDLGFDPPTTWATATAYIANNTVFSGTAFYQCLVSHTSGTFSTDLAAGKWELIADFTPATADAEAAQAAAEAAQALAEAARDSATASASSASSNAASASASANSASADAEQTAADRIATAADRVATAADRVQTGLDVVSSAASAAAAAASAASIVIGPGGVQEYSENLAGVAAVSPTDGNFIVGNGTTLIAESGATARASLGLTIGTDVQAYDADLTAIAAFSTTGFAVRTASDTWAQRSIAGTSGKITVTNGDGVSGNPTITVGADIAQLTVADQVITGGARVTSLSLGTITSGTVTPDPGDRPMQHYTNNGAHTLAPGSNSGAYYLDITNNGSAGAITTSGWTKVSGDSFTTTNGHKFRCSCSVGDAGSLLVVQAMQ